MKIIKCTTKELRKMNASDFQDGDCIIAGKYYIYIKYGTWEEPDKYDIPSLCSYVELENGKRLDCTPGASYGLTPYFIADFLMR